MIGNPGFVPFPPAALVTPSMQRTDDAVEALKALVIAIGRSKVLSSTRFTDCMAGPPLHGLHGLTMRLAEQVKPCRACIPNCTLLSLGQSAFTTTKTTFVKKNHVVKQITLKKTIARDDDPVSDRCRHPQCRAHSLARPC